MRGAEPGASLGNWCLRLRRDPRTWRLRRWRGLSPLFCSSRPRWPVSTAWCVCFRRVGPPKARTTASCTTPSGPTCRRTSARRLSCSCATGRPRCCAPRATSPPAASAARSHWWPAGTAPSTRRCGWPRAAGRAGCSSSARRSWFPQEATRRSTRRLASPWPSSATETCWTSSGQSFGQAVRVALYAPSEPVLDYNMVIIFIMAVGTVAIGGYWAGSRDVRKYMKHKRDDGPEKQEEAAVDVTPVMIGVFVVMCCSMLVLLYHFYDHLVYAIIGIFCLASSTGLYSCLAPCVRRLPFCECRVPDNSLPYFHKRPQARMLLLALLCIAVSVVWGVFRNEDQWAWVLQDTLGVAFCLYMLRTVRLPTFKACTLLLLVLFLYDVFFVFVTPFLTKSGNSIMVEVATGPSDSATREKLPMVLKVPRLNASPLALCDRPFSLLGFGDILVPGLLVAYCHRFDIQAQSSRVYFVACTVAYGIGLLVTFVALALMQRGQPALLYLVPCTLVTSCLVALWRRELGAFWTGSGFAKDLPQTQWAPAPADSPQPPKDSDAPLSPRSVSQEPVRSPMPPEKPQEPSAPEETGAAAPAQEPKIPDSSTPEATQPGTLA
ncbi:signal peptide peptidase-like 2B isoform X2 [Marmota monax]|uniref:signal peptide peptidase-like 2B isoform X2 n=1 Tax=Marmota monax TaxID=9995 RepID=UPI001EB02735|nr:signal peptide peptidase-like 2B isoform X2 [Marmota monax]